MSCVLRCLLMRLDGVPCSRMLSLPQCSAQSGETRFHSPLCACVCAREGLVKVSKGIQSVSQSGWSDRWVLLEGQQLSKVFVSTFCHRSMLFVSFARPPCRPPTPHPPRLVRARVCGAPNPTTRWSSFLSRERGKHLRCRGGAGLTD